MGIAADAVPVEVANDFLEVAGCHANEEAAGLDRDAGASPAEAGEGFLRNFQLGEATQH